ncbi:phosphopantetheine-binding protein [Francisella sp. 19X1-34]|uniref:phosphopantetheine-binding protein n=1 Tax=Francisella sp. 19X1-34 TaxID=3087177 RepID=UPI003FA5F4A7
MIGELYIGGAGLARGYLNRAELTEERFVSNPFATESDIAKGYTRLYKTGDLVRWLEDGNIEYIGRNDDQVKIRGYRIELGEIENQLSAIAGVKQSCVLAKDRNNNKYLVGYYVSDVESLTQEEILNQLSKVLPEYMVPSVLVKIDSMPLTVNGKLDRKVLPDPEFVNEDSYVAPATELEEKLCTIFAEVLGLERVGITDDFFRIGGNSILAIKLSHRLSKELDKELSVASIFRYKNISNLLSYLSEINLAIINNSNIEIGFEEIF